MSITEQDIKNLTPEHRVVWKEPSAPREYEVGLWEDKGGHLWTDAGVVVRLEGGYVSTFIPDRIVRIIEPTLVPRRGLVIGKPGSERVPLVCFEPDEWYGLGASYSGVEARDLVENHGWKVVGDLTKEKDDD